MFHELSGFYGVFIYVDTAIVLSNVIYYFPTPV